jgi:hypothetical protein
MFNIGHHTTNQIHGIRQCKYKSNTNPDLKECVGELISMLPIATYLRKFSSHSVEEYWCYPNYGP